MRISGPRPSLPRLTEEAQHQVEVREGRNVAGTFTALCSCGWMSGDEGDEAAAEDAGAEHLEDPVRRPVRVWRPEGS